MKIVIHPGLHKTGTTYIQKLFAKNIQTFSGQLWFKPRSFVYNNLTRTCIEKQSKSLDLAARFFESAFRYHDAVFISEENIAGPFYSWKTNEFYPKLAQNISFLLQAIPPTVNKIDIIVTVRSYSSWISSMYLQKLKNGYATPFPIFLQRTDISGLSYYKVLADVLDRCSRKFALNVLLYEDFVRDQSSFLRFFTRITGATLGLRLDHRANQSYSEAAMEAILLVNRIAAEPDKKKISRVLEKLFSSDRGYPKPTFFSQDEIRKYNHMYCLDLERLETLQARDNRLSMVKI